MSWLAIAGTVVSAGVSYATRPRAPDFGNTAAFGQIPEYMPVEYTPLFANGGYNDLAREFTQGNIENFGYGSRAAGMQNAWLLDDEANRLSYVDPGWRGRLTQLQNNASSAAAGLLPSADARNAIAGVNERANLMGYAGSSSPQVAADLGLRQLDLMRTGADLNTGLGNFYAQNFPMQRRQSPGDYFVNPREAIPWAIAENQYANQAAAGERNLQMALEGAADPGAAAQMNWQAMMAGYQGGGGGMYGGGGGGQWGQILSQALRYSGSYSGQANPFMGTYSGDVPFAQATAAQQAAAPYAAAFNAGGDPIPQVYV